MRAYRIVQTGPKIQPGGFHAGLANSAYQPPVETKAAVAEALKVRSSQPAKATRDWPADGVGRVRSDDVVFMRGIIAADG